MRYALIAALSVAAVLCGYGFGYVDAYRRLDALHLELARLGQLEFASHLQRLAERVDSGDVPGARLRMLAVSSVFIDSGLSGLPQKSEQAPSWTLLAERIGEDSVRTYTESYAAQNVQKQSILLESQKALCAAPSSAGSEYNGACRR